MITSTVENAPKKKLLAEIGNIVCVLLLMKMIVTMEVKSSQKYYLSFWSKVITEVEKSDSKCLKHNYPKCKIESRLASLDLILKLSKV